MIDLLDTIPIIERVYKNTTHKRIQEVASFFLSQLQTMRLEWVVVEPNRVVTNQNPTWYRELCSRYMKTRRRGRKLRTIIKRYFVIETLQKFEKGIVNLNTLYAQRILPFLEEFDLSECG